MPPSPSPATDTPSYISTLPYPTRWRKLAIPFYPALLPPPPSLSSKELIERFQTHKNLASVEEASKFGSEAAYMLNMMSNKRLEALGDAYLRPAWMQALADEKPNLSAAGLAVSLVCVAAPAECKD